MPNSIYLLRHCDYENPRNILPGRLPVPLSSEGIEQAKRLRDFFIDKSLSKIYSSAVERCKQTAEIIANDSIPIIYDKRLLETLSAYQGYWGENKHNQGYHFFSHTPELGGENLVDLQKRMADFWEELVTNVAENILICSHGDPLQVLYSYIHNLPLVEDTALEEDIPGWMEKGEFVELIFEEKKHIQTKMAMRL
jgi:broad specificity phosphatase PhoE